MSIRKVRSVTDDPSRKTRIKSWSASPSDTQFVCPVDGVYRIDQIAGGAAGSCSATLNGPGGPGGAAYAKTEVELKAGAVIAVSVGLGGVNTTNRGPNSVVGTPSVVTLPNGRVITAGAGAAGATGGGAGGAGGNATGGDINSNGGAGSLAGAGNTGSPGVNGSVGGASIGGGSPQGGVGGVGGNNGDQPWPVGSPGAAATATSVAGNKPFGPGQASGAINSGGNNPVPGEDGRITIRWQEPI